MPRYEKKTRAKGWILQNTRIGPVLDMKVCLHEDRHSIEILVESLFRDDTVSGVRIVNGIGNYVTESMETKEEEHLASVRPVVNARPRLKPAVTLSSVSFPFRDRKMDIHWNTTITWSRVLWSVKSHDPIATTWSISPFGNWRSSSIWRRLRRMQEEKVRWFFAMATQRLDIYSGKRRRSQEKVFNIAWIQTLPASSCTSQQFQGYSGDAVDPELQDNVLLPEGFYWIHLPRRECKWIEFNNQKWIDFRTKKSQKRKTSRVLHCSKPDGRWKWCGETPRDLMKPRIAPYKNRQMLSTFDLLHSPHMWIQAILLCRKHSTTMQIRIVSRLWFCRRPWRLQINIRRSSVHFRESNVRANKLGVQETDFSFS